MVTSTFADGPPGVSLGTHKESFADPFTYSRGDDAGNTASCKKWPLCRFTETTAGIAAAAAREWDASEDHFRIALRQAESMPYRVEEAEIRRFHAMMLLDRSAPSDRERAMTLVREALDFYARTGMARHQELSRELLNKAAD